MLSRTADSMYWLARYLERMDNVARLIEAAQHMSALSADAGEWRSALIAAGCDQGFDAKHETVTPDDVVRYMTCDRDNPSAILSCLDRARGNARAMRIALTRDMWDAVNEAWLESRALGPDAFAPENLPHTLDWVKRAATRFRGAYAGTMLRNDVYWFTRLGTFIERADNTARILDVKYYVLLPHSELVGGEIDNAQWAAILRSVSAHRSYHWVYRESYKPWRVADYLILNRQMPRSLRSCYDEIAHALRELNTYYGSSNGCETHARETLRLLSEANMTTIFQSGLHEFLADFIGRNNGLGSAISKTYHFAD